ncbi:hypothetical protein QBC34DRAFT_442777 [Podospora aff. communis PSN243]|uniref:AA1-like domain-containing protein n=1 Tax=Podospora aff. communis PSN243 TaxID=3040156 RepID=A0AAV9G7M0_9PEZI|nr:hypothetical protein QBC34DRAFT_442777 [Podospora aff. communis PSN243]
MLKNLLILLTLPLATLSHPGGHHPNDPGHHPKPPAPRPTCPPCPPCPPANTCLTTSVTNPAWSLALSYRAFWYFTTPAHQNSWGSVTLNLTNSAIPSATVGCQADSNRLTEFFYGDQLYPCSVSDAAKAAGVGDTGFRFWGYAGGRRVEVNQTWGCGGVGVKFNAVGGVGLEGMKCTDVSWTNPNWTMGSGEFYSTRDVKCEPVSLTVKPAEERILL